MSEAAVSGSQRLGIGPTTLFRHLNVSTSHHPLLRLRFRSVYWKTSTATTISNGLSVEQCRMQVENATAVKWNTGGEVASDGPLVLQAKRRKSLADDVTEIQAPSVSTKQPSDYQVLVESCEWCMVETWPGEEDDGIIEAAVEQRLSSTVQSSQQVTKESTPSTPNTKDKPTFDPKNSEAEKSGKGTGRKTLGLRMA